MKKLTVLFIAILCISFQSLFSQQVKIENIKREPLKQSETATKSTAQKTNDPLNADIRTLPNGLKVYMTVNKKEPRIYAAIAVKAGSKNDPSETTGLAHYFEHMMFKGTPHFGTLDYQNESILIAKIDSLYEVYRTIKDEKQRRELYKVIDSISIKAAKFAIPNEYDKLMQIIGSKETNAYTSLEETVFLEDFPSNQLENWAIIQADRFSSPVLRLFHTELETIYEEKNMTLTSDSRKVYTSLLEGLFPNHPYGTQTTIGTQEHLKNPSMKNIREFFSTYYVPNNIAICLSGDFNPNEAYRIIEKYFGSYQKKPVPQFTFKPAPEMTSPVVKEVLGPDAESVSIAFRFNGANSKDALILQLIDKIMNNGTAGLIDLNLLQQQKVLEAYSYNMILEDYSAFMLSGKPKTGQTLEDVKNLLFEQIEHIKKGEFDEWLLQAVLNDLKLEQIKSFEENSGRGQAFVESFILGVPWLEYINSINKMSAITKDDIIEFTKAHFNNNYVIVYKKTGKDNTIQKLPKNKVTPVPINRDDESEFLKNIRNNAPKDIAPKFLDFDKDIKKFNVNQIPVNYIKNEDNETFELYYVFDMGTLHNIKLRLALDYLDFIGTSKYSPSEIKQEFYKIGCSFNTYASTDQVYVTLSGLSENFAKGVALFEHLLADAKPDATAWGKYVEDIIQKRKDAKKEMQTIFSYLVSYGIYGEENPSTYKLSEKQLKKQKPEEITGIVKNLETYKHKILFYGSLSEKDVQEILGKFHTIPAIKEYPAKKEFAEKPTDKNQVYFVDFDTPQTLILMVSKGEKGYNPNLAPIVKLFNDYFGMNMNSIVFQEMREARGLAYTAISFYQEPSLKDKSYYSISFIGTQYDKVHDAIDGFYSLLNNIPESEKAFSVAKESVVKGIQTERISGKDILFTYEEALKLGINEDIRKRIFEQVSGFTFADILSFQQKYLKDKNHVILVLGNKKDLSPDKLKQYGQVKILELKEIFGY